MENRYNGTTRGQLYAAGLEAAYDFLTANQMPIPMFLTYEQALSKYELPCHNIISCERTKRAIKFLRSVVAQDGRLQGVGTGFYKDGHVFVNVRATALPVLRPRMCSWSWPGWKTDRTAVGVVAHEVGHYVTELVSAPRTALQRAEMRAIWSTAIRGKKVSGYEPTPDEAGAETLRLFILNPDLLRKALPVRYAFMLGLGLRPVEALLKKGWRKVLGNKNYEAAAEVWIGGAR